MDIIGEEWRPVAGFPNAEVSNHGRIRSLFRGGCNLRRPSVGSEGYLIVGLQNKNHKKTAKLHALIAEAFVGPRPAGMDVNHKDGVKANNTPENLEYVTRSENLKHAFRMGLATSPFGKHGEASMRAILTDEIVLNMRSRYAEGVSRRELATEYGVSYSTVWDITERRSWSHI